MRLLTSWVCSTAATLIVSCTVRAILMILIENENISVASAESN